MRQILLIVLIVLSIVTLIIGGVTSWLLYPVLFSSSADTNAYVYYALKKQNGFVLARSHKGPDGQPLGQPETLVPIWPEFGLSDSDNVTALNLSPDGRYLAINGMSDHGEHVWMYDTRRATVTFKPNAVMGNFLHWLPSGNGHSFLYRPMMPLGPDAPIENETWDPGLWIVDAESGAHQNIDIGMSSTMLVDAVPSPDGSRIVYSTSEGLGTGSNAFVMKQDGSERQLLFAASGLQSVAGLFAWSPDGSRIAYERIADSPAPYVAAGLWLMDTKGGQQERVADVAGGYGYAPVWSPDGKKIAFVVRTNVDEQRADIQQQALQSAIHVYDTRSRQTSVVASSEKTGQQLNINPVWSPKGDRITFTALNPINRVVGGTPRYWTAPVTEIPGREHLQVRPISPMLEHVVAWG